MKANNIQHRFVFFLWLSLFAVGMFSCKDEDTYVHTSSVPTVEYKIAVVVPLSNSDERARYEKTANWALETLRNAQRLVFDEGIDSSIVNLSIEWYDESKENLTLLSKQLSRRDDILLTVGPLADKNVNAMAQAFSNEGKALIAPCATSEDIIRRHSKGTYGANNTLPFLWSLCETDVAQSEVLLATAWEGGAESVALISPADSYGQTFSDWVPFQASELGLTFVPSDSYEDIEDLPKVAQSVLSSEAQCVLCAVRSVDEAKVVLELVKKMELAAPRLLFAGRALSATLPELGEIAEGAEGVAPYADPETGFQIAYQEHFKTNPTFAEAQLYDAILLAGITAFVKEYVFKALSAIDILVGLVTTEQNDAGEIGSEKVWNAYGLSSLFLGFKETMDFTGEELVGACGRLCFDNEVYTSILESTYVHWMVYRDSLLCIDYHKRDGSKRVSATLASWNWQVQQRQTIVNEDAGISYKALNDRWALLVQSSKGWRNYRHQADVLNVYQLLKRNGWDDDHIILIISDDIADYPQNPFMGEVRASYTGDNLYSGITIDYNTDTLTAADIVDILEGKRSEHLPTVLETDDQTNLLVFWSGHGCRKGTKTDAGFLWLEDGVFSDVMLRGALETMNSEKRYRKMLMLFEPCYSETMINQAIDIPGILSFSSASKNESSFADYYCEDIGWMSDRFSNNIVREMSINPTLTFYELYTYLIKNTLGSHVHVANASMFGNLYLVSPQEFF